MLANMRGQQTGGPKLLGIAQIHGFLAGESNDPGSRLSRQRGSAATTRQIGQRLCHAEFQSLAQAPFNAWSAGAQRSGNLRNGVSRLIAQLVTRCTRPAGWLRDCDSPVSISISSLLNLNGARRLTKGNADHLLVLVHEKAYITKPFYCTIVLESIY